MEFKCPKCETVVTRAHQNKMAPFASFKISTIECESCGSNIQWHSSLHRKIILSGIAFKLGLLLIVLSFTAIYFKPSYFNAVFLLGALITGLGVFSTWTSSKNVKFEIVEKT